jgi:hypothetical protein
MNVLGGMLKEIAMVYSTVLSKNLPGGIEENYKILGLQAKKGMHDFQNINQEHDVK